MRKALLVLLLSLGLVLPACGDDENGEGADTVEDTAADTAGDTDEDQEADVSSDTSDVDDIQAEVSDIPSDQSDIAPDTSDVMDMVNPDADDMAEDTMDVEDMGMGLPDGPSSERQTAIMLDDTTADNGYYEYLPVGYGNGQDYPILVFWHGLGENGDGNGQLTKVLNNGPPRLIDRDEWDSTLPLIVLSPQHSGGGCPSADEIKNFFDFALDNYDVDTTRVYLTGLSCGAIGSWNYLGKYLDQQIAAIVPIAGNGNPAWNRSGCEIGLVPIWAFHGDADGVVGVGGTNGPINNLLAETDGVPACPSPPRKEVMKTIYEGVGHNSWSRTYNGSAGHDIYSWMLTKSK